MSKKSKTNKQTNKVKNVVVSAPGGVINEKIVMTKDDADKIRAIDSEIRNAKLQLADIQIQLSDLNNKQSELVNTIKTQSSGMIKLIHEIAIANGIDPEGTNSNKKWNFDTSDMTFYRIA